MTDKISRQRLRHVRNFSYMADGRKGIVSGVIANGAAHGKKAFIVVFRFFNKAGIQLPGPYEALSFSKIGAYRYLAGGAPFSITLVLPEGAARVDVSFSNWACDEPIALAEGPHVNATWRAMNAPAVTVMPVRVKDQYKFQFPSAAPYEGMTYAVKPHHSYMLDVTAASDEDGGKKSFLAQVKWCDADGTVLAVPVKGFSQSPRYGSFSYIADGKGVVAFTAPPDAASFHVHVHPWSVKSGTVTLNSDLRLKQLPRADVASALRDQLDRLLQITQPGDAFLCIYTGTKRIGDAHRANRSMMFARESAAMGISTIYTYAPGEAETDFDCTHERLLQIPLNHFDALAAHIAVSVPSARKLFLGSFPDSIQARNIGLFRQLGWRFVYECRDDWEEFASVGSAHWYDEAFERFSAAQASRVFCVSPALREKMQRYTKTPEKVLLSPNATSDDFIASALPIRRAAMVKTYSAIKKPRIVYFGHLTDAWFDWDAVFQAAHDFPQAQFELIGFDMPALTLPANVRYLGSKSHAEIVQIARFWDLGLIPFKHGKLSRAVDPIKIYEYMALGLRSVATPMGDLENFPMTFCYPEFGLTQVLDEALAYIPTAKDWQKIEKILNEAQWRKRLVHLLRDSGIPWDKAA